jgi:hypothetical protein
MVAVVWSIVAAVLFAGAVYFQKRAADIEADVAGMEPMMAFIGTAFWRGSTPESRQYRNLLLATKATGILAMVQMFRVLHS